MKNIFKKITSLRIIILFIINYSLLISAAEAQWSLKSNTDNGKYSLVTNTSGYFGIGAGMVQGESVFALTAADTANWKLVSNTDNGLYSLIENKTTYMGVDAGKIRVKAVYLLNSGSSLDTTRLVFLDKSNSFVGRKQTFDTVNATVKYMLNGVNINTAGTLSNVAYLNQTNNFTGAFSITAPGLTGSSSTSILDVNQTWNTTGTPTALKINITNTASNISSMFIDLQLSGTSVFSVRRDGRVNAASVISASDVIAGANNGISWFGRGGLASGSASNVFAYGTGFSCFGIGGITSSYPGLSPSTGGSLKIMLADLSGYTKTIGGDFVHDDSSKGVVLKDSNGHYWRITISTGGTLSTTDLGTNLTGF